MPEELKLYYEDTETVDGRMVTQTTWRELVPLMAYEDSEAGEYAEPVIVGVLHDIRREGNVVWGTPSVSLSPYVGLACQPTFDRFEPPDPPPAEGEPLITVGPRLSAVVLGRNPAWEGLEVTDA